MISLVNINDEDLLFLLLLKQLNPKGRGGIWQLLTSTAVTKGARGVIKMLTTADMCLWMLNMQVIHYQDPQMQTNSLRFINISLKTWKLVWKGPQNNKCCPQLIGKGPKNS